MRKKSAVLAVAVFLSSPARAAGPVVVELFTSQGCSSCPDADRVLSTWGMKGFRDGSLLPLSFDVDYWDYLGWKDVFSAPAWSERQRRYAAALGGGVYTPELVVAGREALVGSQEERARSAVARLSGEKPRARLELKALASDRAKVEAVAVPGEGAAGLHAVIVLFETGLITEVGRGENGGRSLRNDFVVRRLTDLGALEAGKPLRRALEQSWDPSWRKDRSGAALFLQDPETLAIHDARSVYPLK